MSDLLARPCTAFAGSQKLAQGQLIDVALAVKAAEARSVTGPLITFDDATGAIIDFDLRGSNAEIVARLTQRARQEAARRQSAAPEAKQGPGRPKLGVVAREVTLLPRHWEWLGRQSGGSSNALRRLVEEAIRSDGGRTAARAAQEVCYKVCTTLAGNLPGYEEAMRALYRGDAKGFTQHTARWPKDVRTHARKLAANAQVRDAGSA